MPRTHQLPLSGNEDDPGSNILVQPAQCAARNSYRSRDIFTRRSCCNAAQLHYVLYSDSDVKSLLRHHRPARYFAENIGSLASELSEDELNRFQQIFDKLNKLL